MCSPSIRTSPSPASSSGMRAADPAARATSTGDTLGVVPKTRLVSLDVFRGLTVAAMVLVNNPGTWRAVYAPLRHADWHGWTPTDLIFPFFLFNKALWSSSYAVFTAGAALVVLAACYWLVEIKGSRWWTPPFVVLGVNALAVFFLSTLLSLLLLRIHIPAGDGRLRPLQAVLFETLFAPWAPAAAASLAWALATVLLWLFVMWPLFRKGIRFTV